jgi:hypothetical protein
MDPRDRFFTLHRNVLLRARSGCGMMLALLGRGLSHGISVSTIISIAAWN